MMMALARAREKRITRPRRSVHQASFLNALCQAWVRSTTQHEVARSGAGLARVVATVEVHGGIADMLGGLVILTWPTSCGETSPTVRRCPRESAMCKALTIVPRPRL